MKKLEIHVQADEPGVYPTPKVDHDFNKMVGDHWPGYKMTIKIGSWSIGVSGWKFCGHVPRGAHANIDGSGLLNWGDSQHGFWSVMDEDGQSSGLPRATANPFGEVTIYPGDHTGGGGQVPSDIVNRWNSPKELADEINNAIENASPDVEEPGPYTQDPSISWDGEKWIGRFIAGIDDEEFCLDASDTEDNSDAAIQELIDLIYERWGEWWHPSDVAILD